MVDVFLGIDCSDFKNGISGTGGIESFKCACGNIGEKSIEVVVV